MSISPQPVLPVSSEPVQVLDLRHFSARQLRPLLLEEAVEWERTLDWNYHSSVELLLQYLDSRVLPGFVVTVAGHVRGYAFCVYEGNKAVLGDVYVSREADQPAHLRALLLVHLLELLDASPGIDRIESQLLLYGAGELTRSFEQAGFLSFRRLYQTCSLTGPHQPTSPTPHSIELRPWIPAAYQPMAELIHAAYAGHLDAEINDQYRTLHGTLRFLHNIIRFPGCGSFDPDSSLLLRDTRTDALAGALLCSRIGPAVAHLTQLCVAPEHRRAGLGRALLSYSLRQLPSRGYRSVTLTVSEANHPALRLYGEFGFQTSHRFDALVREPRRVTPEPLELNDGPPPSSVAIPQSR